MGIYVVFGRKGFHDYRDEAEARISLGTKSLKAIEFGVFIPKKIEFWRWAPFKEDGRLLLPAIELKSAESASGRILEIVPSLRYQDITASVIRVYGTWGFNSSQFPGFVGINNSPYWRETYKDIELDAFTKDPDRDLSDYILDQEKKGVKILDAIIKELQDGQILKLNAIYAFHGLFSKAEIFNAKALLYGSESQLVTDLLASFRENVTTDVERRAAKQFSPYRTGFIVPEMLSNKEFAKKFQHIAKDVGIEKSESHSVLFVGKHNDSFKRLYERVSKELFFNVGRRLPTKQEFHWFVSKAMGQTNLDAVLSEKDESLSEQDELEEGNE